MSDLIALVTSVGMEDYLAYTARRNRDVFKEYYVVTSEHDSATEAVCKTFGATTVKFAEFHQARSVFNKSGGVRMAQEIVHQRHPGDWVTILDVDIIVDERLSGVNLDSLDKKNLYGMMRFDVHKYEDYKCGKFKRHPGTARGKIIGYFQMYFDKSKYYGKESRNACGCDVSFASMFKENLFLDDLKAIHVGRAASHWNGRSRERLDWPD